MKTYQIHLLRHGQTDEAAQGKYIGHTDVPLSDTGRAELALLRELGDWPEPDVLFCSPLLRCLESAKLLFPEKKPLVIDGLIECSFGEFEDRSAAELESHPVFSDWLAGEPGAEPPFGESSEAFAARVCKCFLQIVQGLLKTGTTNAAILTHGGVIMTILANFGLPEAPMHEWMTPCGCGFTLRLTPTLWARGQKLEVIAACPANINAEEEY